MSFEAEGLLGPVRFQPTSRCGPSTREARADLVASPDVSPPGTFEREGWTRIAALFSPTECDAIAAADARRSYPAVNRELAEWATDPRWADPAMGALGPNVRLLREQPLHKHPESAATVPWHQDAGYTTMRPVEFLTCIVALDGIDEGNGCLRVLPRSHRGGLLPHEPAGAIQRVSAAVVAEIDGADDQGVPVELARGDVVLFSSLTLHRSGPNRSRRWRRSWLVQFCSADTIDVRTGHSLVGCPLVADDGRWRPFGSG